DMLCIPTPYRQLDLYRDAQRQGFTQHVRVYYDFEALQSYPIPPITDADRTGQVAIGGIKLFMDGSISNRTAWMRDPYPGTAGDRGIRMCPPQRMIEALAFARSNGLQISVHAMGDRAIQEVVDVWGDEAPWMGEIPSVRIEHASVLDPDLMRRIADARMTFGVATNVDFFYCEVDSYSANLSPAQFARTYAVRDMQATIERLALSSDSPATTWADPDNVFLSIQAAVTRRAYNGADIVAAQEITVPEAVLLFTGRARTVADTLDIGMIAPGFQASFITLADDIFEIDPGTIIDLRVTGTWIRGERVYAA
ncbi:MAG: amidohydrolase family protein, partial [Anaerolineae bacterium]|nr:amidohydrolase family protein [Anaerolineae bacterium]